MYAEIEALILSVAGKTVPLNNLKLIYDATGFNTVFEGKDCEGSCAEHRDTRLPQMDCCKAFRKGFALGSLLAGQRPEWIIHVYEIGSMKHHTHELWIHGENALKSKYEWKEDGHHATFDPVRTRTK